MMSLNLADFLRTTLALDPRNEIPLDEEIRLQMLYLDVEKVRSPERLVVKLEIPDELRQALIPSLITQPLIENSIKHAVSRSTAPVEIGVSASARDSCLRLIVEDDGGDAELAPGKGANIGLSNVAERLAVHYGPDAKLEAAKGERSGFCNIIELPLRFAG
jgi:LytS/YehU family sensor histidine kinase